VRLKDSASGSEICHLWRDRISGRDCPQFPNELVQFLMFLADNCVVSLAGICVVFICDLVLTCKKKKEKKVKIDKFLIKVSYQLIHRRNVHRRKDDHRKVHRRIGVAEMSHSVIQMIWYMQTVWLVQKVWGSRGTLASTNVFG